MGIGRSQNGRVYSDRARGAGRIARRRLRWWQILLRVGWLFAFFGAAILVGVIGGTYYSLSRMLPANIDINSVQKETEEKTKIYSADGVLLAEVFEENREFIPIEQIPRQLQNAVVAIEDKYFYKHSGINLRSIGRALYENLRENRISQGGSTITQQLARNIWLSPRKTFSRKIQEAMLAVQVERNYTKEQILELYLNEVYLGSGAYGVKTAAEVYFGKDVKKLTLAEFALLAGLPQRPSSYSPYEDKELARKRRNTVLRAMAHQGYITAEEAQKAQEEPIRLAGKKPIGSTRYKAPYFVTYVLKQMIDKYGADLVYKGGLRIYTTLNYRMQQIAESAVQSGVASSRSMKVGQGALLCMEPQTGKIRAMVGGTDFRKSQFNRTTQARRQPGSSFKPIVYTAALDKGHSPDERINDSPVSYPSGSKVWRPKNYDHRYHGHVTMRTAVAQSINIPAIRMMEEVGIQEVINYAQVLGIRQELEPNLSLAIGTASVTMMEMVTVYGVFANPGNRVEPMAVAKITDRKGNLIEEFTLQVRQVISEETARQMDSLLRGVVERGTGRMVRDVPRARAKTGTTQDHRDAWFIGYTPELVTAVWVGNDDYSPMGRVWGGNVCAPIWEAFMKPTLAMILQPGGKTVTVENGEARIEEGRRSRRRRYPRPEDIYRRLETEEPVPAPDTEPEVIDTAPTNEAVDVAPADPEPAQPEPAQPPAEAKPEPASNSDAL
ncbi:MAG: penicillin-binding protein 1A [Armatimonadetes bacterium]|nr:penicillin-binding protein 1A [Armatimonadota bacterium]